MKERNEQLIHIRRYTKDGRLLSTGGATIIIKRTDDPHKFVVDVAECSTNDVFCRRIGRAIATGRATKHPEVVSSFHVRTLYEWYHKRLTKKAPEWYPAILESK